MPSSFRFDNIKGQIAKEIVRGLLEDSKYETYPFGYESLLSPMRFELHGVADSTHSAKRLRSSPDLIVYDQESKRPYFTEIKFRNAKDIHRITLGARSIEWYQQYWNDSVLVAVVPAGHAFYAQYVNRLRPVNSARSQQIEVFDLLEDFAPIEEIFSRIDSIALEEHQILLHKIEILNDASSAQ